jgi:hypothetical protein
MYSQLDVLTTLGSEQMSSRTRAIDPAFARAVFESYIQCKLRKGRTKYEISAKLQDLERGVGSAIAARFLEVGSSFC